MSKLKAVCIFIICLYSEFSLSASLFSVTAMGNKLSIKPTVKNRTYNDIGITLSDCGNFQNPSRDCVSFSDNVCTVSASNTLPAAIAVTTSGVCSIKACLSATGFSCQNVRVSLATSQAYVPLFSSNVVQRCDVESNGVFSGCVDAMQDDNSLLNQPTSIIFNRLGNRAYISNFGKNSLVSCSVEDSGFLSSCKDEAIVINKPRSMALINSNKAYIVSQGDNEVLLCAISTEGTFSHCSPSGNTGVPFNQPQGIVLNNAKSLAYITNLDSGHVSICPINNDYSFGYCRASSNTFVKARDLKLNSNDSFAYIAEGSAKDIKVCQVDSTGDFANCKSVLSNALQYFQQPRGIDFLRDGTMAFITNFIPRVGQAIVSCSVNTTTGEFTACQNTGVNPIIFKNSEFLSVV